MTTRFVILGPKCLAEVAHNILKRLDYPIRIPTFTWLFSDVFDILDCEARELIVFMKENGYITQTEGGWLEVK